MGEGDGFLVGAFVGSCVGPLVGDSDVGRTTDDGALVVGLEKLEFR